MRASLAPFTPEFRDSHGNLFGSGVGRSKGTHLSGVIKYLRIKLGDLKETGNDAFAMFGFIFELLVEQALAHYLTFNQSDMIEPGEGCCDDIYMTPDRVNPFLGPLGTVFEYKATWKSIGGSRTNPSILDGDGGIDVEVFQERFWYWLVQLMSYCRMMGTTKGTIVALFINGDYTFRDPWGGPRFLVIECEFTEEELETNWKMVVREARAMEKEA